MEQPVSERDIVPPFDPSTAIPLSRAPSKKKAGISKFRQALMESRKQGETENKPAGSKADKEKDQVAGRSSRSDLAEERNLGTTEEVATESYGQQAVKRRGNVEKGRSVRPNAQLGEKEAIDAENRARLAAMSPDEVAAEQASLQEMLPPGVLEALKKRGAKKLVGATPDSSSKLAKREEENDAASGGERKVPLRRQPTPMPGVIPEMRKGVQDSLAPVSEDESLEIVTELPKASSNRGKQEKTPLQEGALRRQPTPLPGVIPKVVKAGAPCLSPLAEEMQGDEDAVQAEEDLKRADGPMQQAARNGDSAKAYGTQATENLQSTESEGSLEPGLSSIQAALEFGRATSSAQQSPSLNLHSQGREKVEMKDTGTSRRQPTPMPSEIVSLGAGKETVLETLEEEDEELDTSAQQKQREVLKRQGTPMPSEIVSLGTERESILETLQEEDEELEASAQQKKTEVLKRQGKPMPSEFVILGAERESVEDEQEEPKTSALQKQRGDLKRQGTPMPSEIVSLGAPKETILETLEEEEPETSAQQIQREALRRQGTPMPSEFVSLGAERATVLETLEEEDEKPETSGQQKRGGNLKRQGTPLPSAIPAPKRGLESPLETLQEDDDSSNETQTEPEPNPNGVGQFEKVNASDLRFDLDGAPLAPAYISSTSDERKVAERDILRSGGDPSASGYTLKEATALARSTIPGQRTVALRLISAVLRRALAGMHGLELTEFGKQEEERRQEELDAQEKLWARVWAYALSSDVQLAVVLR